MYYEEHAFARRSGATSTPEGQDPRTPFARDRDRLLYSSAFRRLAGKSQVVASIEIGPFHTRLTHSLKVAQLGRRLAEQIQAVQTQTDTRDRRSSSEIVAPDPDLVEFACLAHDLGHPPFGHTGESALHKVVDHLVGQAVKYSLKSTGREEEAGVISEAQRYIGGFEGNPQTFRIVTRLSHKAFPGDPHDDEQDEFLGLDLTAAAIDAVSKYPWERETLDCKKWGAYGAGDDLHSDYGVLAVNRERLEWSAPPSGERAKTSFECQLMDWCDDVTYAVHDVEDFYTIGMIPLERIFGYERVFRSLGGGSIDRTTKKGTTGTQVPETDEWLAFRTHLQDKWAKETDHLGQPRETDSDYLDELRAGLIDVAYGPTGWDAEPGTIKARRLSLRRASDLIAHFASTNVGYDGEPLLNQGRLVVAEKSDDEDKQQAEDKRRRHQCDMLQELIWKYVINIPNLKTQQAGQRRVIEDLVKTYAADTDLLPQHYVELADSGAGYKALTRMKLPDGCIKRLAVIRAAADYVSSLTEPQALALHKRLTGVELGGFRDFV